MSRVNNQQLDRAGEAEAAASDLHKWVALQSKGSVLKKACRLAGVQLLEAAQHAFSDPATPVNALVVIANAVGQLVPLLNTTQSSPTPLPHDKALQLTQLCVQLMYDCVVKSCPEVRQQSEVGPLVPGYLLDVWATPNTCTSWEATT